MAKTRIPKITGTRGGDEIVLGGAPGDVAMHARVNLGHGEDRLHLNDPRVYALSLDKVEHLSGHADAALFLQGRAEFSTDGSIGTILSGKGPQKITFTDIAADCTLMLSHARNVITFGAGFEFARSDGSAMTVSRGGHTLTIDDQAAGDSALVIDGVRHSFRHFLSTLSAPQGPSVRAIDTSADFLSDASAGSEFVLTVIFDRPMDMGTSPVISFGTDLSGTLTLVQQEWIADTNSWMGTYLVSDAGVDADGVTVGVSGVRDAQGLALRTWAPRAEFDVHMQNSTVTQFSSDIPNLVGQPLVNDQASASWNFGA